MDAHTSLQPMQESLEKIYSELKNKTDLSSIMEDPQWFDGVKVARVEQPTTWRLLQGPEGAEEEIVFNVRGIITAKDLPPILLRPRVTRARFKYLRQSVTISGLGTATFDKVLAATAEIYGLFDRSFPDGQLSSWMASSSPSIGDFSGIDASNRYMVPKKDVQGIEHQGFGVSVDPKQILEDMALESDNIHTEENKVLYFTSRVDRNGQRTFSDALPQVFRVGDIVELQVSFIVVPLKGEQYKMMTTLHSIALLDGTYAQEQSASRVKSAQRQLPVAPKPLLSVKRRVGYALSEQVQQTNEDVEDKRVRIDMEIDEGAGKLSTEFSTQL